jgi:hypothetical protein
MMLLAIGLVCAGSLAAPTASASPSNSHPLPGWLATSNERSLRGLFDGGKLLSTHYIWSPRKVAVVFEFERVAICGSCSAPSNAELPRGRLVRITYDRRNHRGIGGLEFCEARKAYPLRSFCLRR